MRIITFFLLFTAVFLSACSPKGSTPSDVTGASSGSGNTETTEPAAPPLDYEDGSYTLFIYMCGSSLETKNGSATKNITEMLSAKVPEKTKIVIETGGTKKWRKYDIPTDLCRYEIINGELKQIEKLGLKSMGEAETLTDFLAWGIEAYPSERYSLILWDHGGGSIKGVCFDELFSGDALSLPELGEALRLGLQKYGTKLDFIGFDACLMATVEAAMTVSDYAGHMIASQELEPAGGWDYNLLLPSLGTDAVYQTVLDSYADKSAKSNNYYTLSHIDFSKFSNIKDTFTELVHTLKDEPLQVKIVNALTLAETFGTTSGNGSSDLYDLGNLCEYFEIDTDFAALIQTVASETRTDATGLSVYFPLNDTSFVEEYYKLNRLKIYSDYLKQFLSYHVDKTILFESYDIDLLAQNLFSFNLTPESMKYLWKINYRLYSRENDVLWSELGLDNDLTIQNNKVTILFEGNWIEWNGRPLYCQPKESNGKITVFESMVKVENEIAILLFSFDSDTSAVEIIGVTYREDNYSRIYDIPDNALLTPVSVDNVVIRDDEGNIVSASSSLWFNPENSFYYTSDMRINVIRLPDGEYQYIATVFDIYGKRFHAGTINIQIIDGAVYINSVDTELTGASSANDE